MILIKVSHTADVVRNGSQVPIPLSAGGVGLGITAHHTDGKTDKEKCVLVLTGRVLMKVAVNRKTSASLSFPAAV